MKSFLLKDNKPTIKFSLLPEEIYFEGEVPVGYALAVCPTGNYIILDVDNKNGKNGFENIPEDIFNILSNTFNYKTKSGGAHYWLKYTGNKTLLNTSTKYGLDLRVGARHGNAGGYVKYHHNVDIRQCIHLIKETSNELNQWLENLFLGVNYEKKEC
jgi:hypothetical protein